MSRKFPTPLYLAIKYSANYVFLFLSSILDSFFLYFLCQKIERKKKEKNNIERLMKKETPFVTT